MATLDIKEDRDEAITDIKFDFTKDRVITDDDCETLIFYKASSDSNVTLCRFNDLDDFIAAAKKAKELWHNK